VGLVSLSIDLLYLMCCTHRDNNEDVSHPICSLVINKTCKLNMSNTIKKKKLFYIRELRSTGKDIVYQ